MLRPDEITTHPEVIKLLYEEIEPTLTEIIKTPSQKIDLLRERIGVWKVEENKLNELTVVIDGGYNPIRLDALEIVPNVAIATFFKGYEEVRKPLAYAKIKPILLAERDAEKYRAMINDSLIMQLATKVLKEYKPDFLIIDGELPPFSGIPASEPVRDPDILFQEFPLFVKQVKEFLEIAKQEKAKIAGFVKSPRGTGFQRFILHVEPHESDSSLFGRLLAHREATNCYSLRYKSYLRKWLPEYNLFGFYLKCKTKGGANRVEIPEWCLPQVKEIAGYFLAYATPQGWPYQVHKTDYYARVSYGLRDKIYTRWLLKLKKKVDEGILKVDEISHYTLSPREYFSLSIEEKAEFAKGEEIE